jgi:hypothetical protein
VTTQVTDGASGVAQEAFIALCKQSPPQDWSIKAQFQLNASVPLIIVLRRLHSDQIDQAFEESTVQLELCKPSSVC